MNRQPRIFYRRHLPHYHPPNATYHVVFRLTGSLPGHVIERLKSERSTTERTIAAIENTKRKREEWAEYQKAYFRNFDGLLDGAKSGPKWLMQPEVARCVCDAIHYRDGTQLDVYAYCIMPNHVHLVCTVGRADCPTYSLTNVIGSLKWFTALKANRILRRTGPFWQGESYDHVIRDGEELSRTIWYVLQNPVKAGLVKTADEWSWTYCKAEVTS